MNDGRSSRGISVAAFVVMAIGIVLRARAMTFDRSLWLDELLLWSTLGDDSIGRFLHPLGEGQVAAPGFVLLAQCLRRLLGDSEWVLRLPAFLAGVASLPLLWRVARRILEPAGALFALSLLAIGPTAIYYAEEFKPYSIDLCATLLILTLVIELLERDKGTTSSLALLVVGLLTVFVCLPAPLVLASAGVTLLAVRIRQNERRAAAIVALCCAAWFAVFLVQYLGLLGHQAGDVHIRRYWMETESFPPSGGLLAKLRWIPDTIYDAIVSPVGLSRDNDHGTLSTGIGAALFLLGTVVLIRRKRASGTLVLLVLVFAFLAAIVQAYPFSGRAVLYLLPSLILPIGAGIDALSRKLAGASPWRTRLAYAAAGLLLLDPARVSLRRFSDPQTREEARTMVSRLHARVRPGDVIYVSYWAQKAWRYYGEREPFDRVRVESSARIFDGHPERYAADFAAKANGAERVWIVITHFSGANPAEKPILDAIASTGARNVPDEPLIEEDGALARLVDARAIPR